MTAFHTTDMTVKTCKRCLYRDDHPLGLVIDDDGICSGCRIHEEKDQLDWDHRWHELETLVAPYRSADARNYDCIVPVSGAGDSYFIVHTVVNRLKLKPLLVTYNRYYNTPLGIRNLANLRRKFNVDILIQNVNPRSVKSIIRTTLRRFGSFHWPAIAGQTVFPVQTAVSHRIPLIIWGAHQGLEQVGMFSHLHNVEMTRRYRKDHDLMGYEADDLLSIFDNLKEEDIWQYRYPDWQDLDSVGVRGIYLGNYMRWDPLAQHHEMVKRFGYASAKQNRTFDTYDNVDDWHYSDTHDWIKCLKHGYGRSTDHATREIRHGRMSKEVALKLVARYQAKPTENTQLLTDWLNIDPGSINYILEGFKEEEGRLQNINDEENQKNTATEEENPKIESLFTSNTTLLHNNRQKSHIIIGKGYPD